jgi:mannose-6-phosphate isomerase-like protein (cupin superfamily)
MKTALVISYVFIMSLSLEIKAQSIKNLRLLQNPGFTDGKNSSQNLFNDTLVSSTLIYISKEVKLHKHLEHAEHVLVLEGEGEMRLGTEVFTIKKDDLIFIPKNTPHAVKTISAIPLKVLSIQAPLFDGKDRVVLE